MDKKRFSDVITPNWLVSDQHPMEVGLGEPKGAPGSHVGTKQPNLGLMRRGGLGSVSK